MSDDQWGSNTTIGDLYDALCAERPDCIVRPGISEPHSYRGYYDEAAVELTEACTVGEAMAVVDRLLSETFEGYKGGEYTYSVGTPLWSATWGATGCAYRLPTISPQ